MGTKKQQKFDHKSWWILKSPSGLLFALTRNKAEFMLENCRTTEGGAKYECVYRCESKPSTDKAALKEAIIDGRVEGIIAWGGRQYTQDEFLEAIKPKKEEDMLTDAGVTA